MQPMSSNSHSQPKQMGALSSQDGCSKESKVELAGRVTTHPSRGGKTIGGMNWVTSGALVAGLV